MQGEMNRLLFKIDFRTFTIWIIRKILNFVGLNFSSSADSPAFGNLSHAKIQMMVTFS